MATSQSFCSMRSKFQFLAIIFYNLTTHLLSFLCHVLLHDVCSFCKNVYYRQEMKYRISYLFCKKCLPLKKNEVYFLSAKYRSRLNFSIQFNTRRERDRVCSQFSGYCYNNIFVEVPHQQTICSLGDFNCQGYSSM